MLTEVVSAIVGGGFTLAGNYLFQRRRVRKRNENQWYEDALASVSRGRAVCDLGRERSDINYGSIAEESEKVALRLGEHIAPPPSGVDEKSVNLVANLEMLFRKLAAVTEASDEQSTEGALEEVFRMGQRDLSRNESFDVGKVVNISTDYSPGIANVIDEIDTDPVTFGRILASQFDNAHSFSELFQMMESTKILNNRSVSRKLNEDFFNEDWDENLSMAIRFMLQLTSNLCVETINHLGEANNS